MGLTIDEVHGMMTPPRAPAPPRKTLTPGQQAVKNMQEYARLKMSMSRTEKLTDRKKIRDAMRALRSEIVAYLGIPYEIRE